MEAFPDDTLISVICFLPLIKLFSTEIQTARTVQDLELFLQFVFRWTTVVRLTFHVISVYRILRGGKGEAKGGNLSHHWFNMLPGSGATEKSKTLSQSRG